MYSTNNLYEYVKTSNFGRYYKMVRVSCTKLKVKPTPKNSFKVNSKRPLIKFIVINLRQQVAS